MSDEMQTLQPGGTVSLVYRLLKDVERLITTDQLSLADALEKLRTDIGCQLVALVSRRDDSEGRPLWDVARWRRGRSSRIEPDALFDNPAFVDQFEKLVASAEDFADPIAYNDVIVSPTALDGLEAPENWEDLTQGIAVGGTIICHVGVIPLGYQRIGPWNYGETFLVMVDAKDEKEEEGCSRWWNPRLQVLPFLCYIAEVNAHFFRKLSFDKLAAIKRREEICCGRTLEQTEYLRSCWRLAPLLDSDVPVTVETLVLIHSALPESGTADVKGLRKLVSDAFSGLMSSFYCLGDGQREPDSAVARRRRTEVECMIEATCLWWQVQECLARRRAATRGEESGDSDWPKTVRALADSVNSFLARLPSVLWPETDGELDLNGRRLASFFLCKLVEWRNAGKILQATPLGGGFGGAVETLLFLERLTTVVRYALGCCEPDATVLRALLWLVSEFGHQALGVDRRVDLEKHLGLAAMEQPALYSLKAFYRDHLTHVIEVCLSGWLVMESRLSGGETVLSRVGAAIRGLSDDEVLRQWFAASLLHDVGYVVDVGKGWTDLLHRFDDRVCEDLRRRVDAEIGKLTAEVVSSTEWGFDDDQQPGLDHGAVSAVHVREMLKEIGSTSLAAEYGHALKAIARHNHPDLEIKFADEPLSAVLVICDELQEWDRPWLDLDRAGLAISVAVSFGTSQYSNWHQPLVSVKANIRSAWDEETTCLLFETDNNVLDFRLQYGPDAHRNDSLFNIWLGRSSSLQRLEIDDAGFDIRYRLINGNELPESLTRRDGRETAMDRLWRLVRDERVWSLQGWMPSDLNDSLPDPGSGPVDRGVQYAHDLNAQTETLVLNVKALGTEKPMSDGLKEFFDKWRRWRYAVETQDPDL